MQWTQKNQKYNAFVSGKKTTTITQDFSGQPWMEQNSWHSYVPAISAASSESH